MFLNRLRPSLVRISTKLTLAYSLVFILSSVLIFGYIYYQFSNVLLLEETRIFQEMQVAEQEAGQHSDSKWGQFSDHFSAQEYDQSKAQIQNQFQSQKLNQVQTKMHQEHLNMLQKIFWGALLPVSVIGFLCGIWLSNSTLSPVREVINSMKKIQTGSFSTRVPVGGNRDELEELKVLYNKMLDKIENLVGGLKEAFDHLAHDIRTPVTRLRGRAEIALNSEGDVDSYREALQSCFENSDKILNFLQMLTDITEAENRSKKLKLEKKYISHLVGEMMSLYEMAFEDKEITVVQNLDPQDWAIVDARLISRVIANLLDNALKYTPRGGAVTIETVNNTESVVLRVTDTGAGIVPEEQSMIWQKLYRSDKSRSAYGMGLGLTFVRAIVLAHDGKVGVMSPVKDGHGSTFEVVLQKMA